jgi:hypothetical protein
MALVSFADGGVTTTGGATDMLFESPTPQHRPRPPPSKNSKNVMSNLHQQQQEQQRQQQQTTQPLPALQPEEIQYVQNRRTSSLTYKPTRVFSYDNESQVDLSSPFVVGAAELLRQKARDVAKYSSFATPLPKPMLRCRSIRPADKKQGPSVRHVPLSDDQWTLSEQEKERLALKEGVGFGKTAENSIITYPTVS